MEVILFSIILDDAGVMRVMESLVSQKELVISCGFTVIYETTKFFGIVLVCDHRQCMWILALKITHH